MKKELPLALIALLIITGLYLVAWVLYAILPISFVACGLITFIVFSLTGIVVTAED